jgi:hypothetical protein
MTSWRDSVPEAVQEDLDGLFNVALDAASEFLVKNGAFFPFGFSVDAEDAVAMFGADPGLGERPPSTEVLRLLGEGARADRERLRAVAIAVDVSLPDGGDAMRVELEHREGAVLEILVPYRRRRFGGKLTLGEMSVSEGQAQVWAV